MRGGGGCLRASYFLLATYNISFRRFGGARNSVSLTKEEKKKYLSSIGKAAGAGDGDETNKDFVIEAQDDDIDLDEMPGGFRR